MHTKEIFQQRWAAFNNRYGHAFTPEGLSAFALPDDTRDFLLNHGLPILCEPALFFFEDPATAEPDDAIYMMPPADDETDAHQYLVIGHERGGALVFVDMADGEVSSIPNDSFPQAAFMNTSLYQMASCILTYQDFLAVAGGPVDEPDAYNESFTDPQLETLRAILEEIDERCVQEGFWARQLDRLLHRREQTRQLKTAGYRKVVSDGGLFNIYVPSDWAPVAGKASSTLSFYTDNQRKSLFSVAAQPWEPVSGDPYERPYEVIDRRITANPGARRIEEDDFRCARYTVFGAGPNEPAVTYRWTVLKEFTVFECTLTSDVPGGSTPREADSAVRSIAFNY